MAGSKATTPRLHPKQPDAFLKFVCVRVTVNAGDTIAILDDAQIRAREDQARDALSEAEARRIAAEEQIAVLQEQLAQSRLQVGQSRLDTEGHIGQAEADLATAQAELAQQQAAYQIAEFDKEAYTRLAKSGAVKERQGLQASTTADQQFAVVTASRRRVEASQSELTTAQASLSNPGIRESQVASVRRQIAEQEAEVASAMARTEEAQAELAEAEDNRNDLTIRAPFSGTVVARAAEPGEVVNGRDADHHTIGPNQGVSARLCSRRPNRQSESGTVGPSLSRFQLEETYLRLRLQD